MENLSSTARATTAVRGAIGVRWPAIVRGRSMASRLVALAAVALLSLPLRQGPARSARPCRSPTASRKRLRSDGGRRRARATRRRLRQFGARGNESRTAVRAPQRPAMTSPVTARPSAPRTRMARGRAVARTPARARTRTSPPRPSRPRPGRAAGGSSWPSVPAPSLAHLPTTSSRRGFVITSWRSARRPSWTSRSTRSRWRWMARGRHRPRGRDRTGGRHVVAARGRRHVPERRNVPHVDARIRRRDPLPDSARRMAARRRGHRG